MTILVAGSAGHLGEGLMRTFRESGQPAVGADIKPSPYTDHVGSISDREFVREIFRDGIRAVIHTAALHKPHVVTHSHQEFIDTNLSGTLALLEAASAAKVHCFVFTSTTSAFGSALTPGKGQPARWITEDVSPVPKNIYGATKLGAEHLCEMFAHKRRLPMVILRTSRFFLQEDDSPAIRSRFSLENGYVNELLFRRVDLEDAVQAHLIALERAAQLQFGRFIISAPTPFTPDDLRALRDNPWAVVKRRFPQAGALFAERGWSMFDDIDRVYVSGQAIARLGWRPRWDFGRAVDSLQNGADFCSELARAIGDKGYHDVAFQDGPYPVEAT
jgi:UDP-glucose 4-epimerase